MLNIEDNELLMKCGPGTAMGNLMRQYWIPAVHSDELPAPDCPPVRILLLNEKLIAFRTTSGRAGLIADACPHRLSSLFFGRNEEEGLRCAYHGWKFDVEGRCVDMMTEEAGSIFKEKVRITAYPCVEQAGIVWAYMGPRATPPPLPDIAYLDGVRATPPRQSEWNWFHCMENNMDTVHSSILHFGAIPAELAQDRDKAIVGQSVVGDDLKYIVGHRPPKFDVRDTDFGVTSAASRPATQDTVYTRLANWLFPFFTMSPTQPLGSSRGASMTVPIDDEHCMSWSLTVRTGDRRAPNPDRAPLSGEAKLASNSDWLGRGRMALNGDETPDWEIDRELQRSSKSEQGFTGLQSVNVQDRAIQWSQGTLPDRSMEHLGPTDAQLIRVRHRLISSAKELRDHGTVPPGVDSPHVYLQRSGWVVLPNAADYWAVTEEQRKEPPVSERVRVAPEIAIS